MMRAMRRDAELASAGVAHDHHGGGTVVERAGVAGRHRATFAEDGLEGGQPFQGRAGPGAVVLRDDVAVGSGHRNDLAFEEARLLGGDGPRLALKGELVLLLAAHLLELGHVLGRLAHGDVDIG